MPIRGGRSFQKISSAEEFAPISGIEPEFNHYGGPARLQVFRTVTFVLKLHLGFTRKFKIPDLHHLFDIGIEWVMQNPILITRLVSRTSCYSGHLPITHRHSAVNSALAQDVGILAVIEQVYRTTYRYVVNGYTTLRVGCEMKLARTHGCQNRQHPYLRRYPN